MMGIKILAKSGKYYYTTWNGIVTKYPVPPEGDYDNWGEWMVHPNPQNLGGIVSIGGGYFVMNYPSFKYASRIGSDFCHIFDAEVGDGDVLGYDDEKSRVAKLRLRRIHPDELVKMIRNGQIQNLKYADLSKLDLSGVDLPRTTLSSTNLTGTNFTGANLSKANLFWSNLEGANLTDTDLFYAILFNANLVGANLAGSVLSWANMTEANLTGAVLSNAILINANLFWSNLEGANLTGANLTDAILPDGTRWVPGRDMTEFTEVKEK